MILIKNINIVLKTFPILVLLLLFNLSYAGYIAKGYNFGVAVKNDGSIGVWGSNTSYNIQSPPYGYNYTSVAAGNGHALAITEEGSIEAWGRNLEGQTNVPYEVLDYYYNDPVIQISAGTNHSLALFESGKVVAWGSNNRGQCDVPDELTSSNSDNPVIEIIAIAYGNTALKSDGTIVYWGRDEFYGDCGEDGAGTIPTTCFDDNSATDNNGNYCDDYNYEYDWSSGCSDNYWTSNDDFSGPENCCVCGGGVEINENIVAIGDHIVKKNSGLIVNWHDDSSFSCNADPDSDGWDYYDDTENLPDYSLDFIQVDGYGGGQGGERELWLGLTSNGEVVVWGKDINISGNNFGEIPASATGVIELARGPSGNFFSALKSDGTVVSWGSSAPEEPTFLVMTPPVYGCDEIDACNYNPAVSDNDGSCFYPENGCDGRFNSLIDQGGTHSIGLTTDGTLLTLDNGGGNSTIFDYPDEVLNTYGLVSVAAGSNATVVLKSDGSVYGWGSGSLSQVPNDASQNVINLDVDGNMAGVVTYDGKVILWGNDYNGSISELPDDLDNVVKIELNTYGVLALLDDGSIVHWGYTSSYPPNNINAIDIAPSYLRSYALKVDGSIVTWGSNNYNSSSNMPSGDNNTGFVQIAGGKCHTLALKSDGTVVAWGFGTSCAEGGSSDFGQTQVPDGLANVVSISASYSTSLALRSDGTIVTWGKQDDQPDEGVTFEISPIFGCTDPDACNYHPFASQNSGLCAYPDGFSGPIVQDAPGNANFDCDGNCLLELDCAGICGGTTVVDECGVCNGNNAPNTGTCDCCAIPDGDGTSCDGECGPCNYNIEDVVDVNGLQNACDCEGNILDCADVCGGSVELDVCAVCDGDAPELVSPYNKMLSAGNKFCLSIDADSTVVHWGLSSSVDNDLKVLSVEAVDSWAFAVKPDSTVVHWGYNYNGNANIPSSLSGVVEVAGTYYHTLALKSNGTVVGWGTPSSWYNYGQMNVPGGITDAVQIAVGDYHSMILKADSTVVVWGIEDGSTNDKGQVTDTPDDLSGVVQIAAGRRHSVALKSDGTVVVWGTSSANSTVTDVPEGLSDVIQISAKYYSTLALKSNGTVLAWGSSTWGLLEVPEGISAVAVEAGKNNSFLVTAAGNYIGWGSSNYGIGNPPDDLYFEMEFSADLSCSGCTDVSACNYNHSAFVEDNGSCWFDDGITACNGSCLVDTDCAGVCNGLAALDECGVCEGGGPEENFDCDGNCIVDIDCAGVCNGSAYIGTVCNDTDGDGLGDPGTDTDGCIGGQTHSITEGCDLPDFNLFLDDNGSVLYNSSEAIGTFQFSVISTNIDSISGGVVDSVGFDVSVVDNIVIAASFSGSTIDAGCGNLVELSLDGYSVGLTDIVVTNSLGSSLPFSYYSYPKVPDCLDEYPDCFYNYFDCNGECGGSSVIDECGVCDGDGDGSACSSTVDLSIDLLSGWNFVSFNVNPEDDSLSSILGSIGDDATFISSQSSGTALNYGDNGWYGGLTELDPTQMYKLQMTSAAELVITGMPVDVETTSISLLVGWNWIGYLPQNAGTLDDALASVGDLATFISSQSSGTALNYGDNGWYGGLTTLEPGSGYLLNMSEPGELIYPEFDGNPRLSENKQEVILSQKISHWDFNYGDYEFLGTITASIENHEDFDGDIVGVFVDGECRGLAERMYFPLDDTYYYTIQVYSNEIYGEELTFKYYDNANDDVIEYSETLTFENNMIVGDGFHTFGLSRVMPTKFMLDYAYPNPFNPSTAINFSIPKDISVSLSVYNMQGREIETLVDGNLHAGYHAIVWNASNYSSGIYFVKMIAGEYINTQKLMLVK